MLMYELIKMTLGTSIKAQVEALIDDPNLKSIFVLKPITRTTGDLGGYRGVTETEGTNVSVNCIPSNHVKTLIGLQKLGDLKMGELRFLIKDDQVIDTDDKVTFDGNEYLIRSIKPIPFNLDNDGNTINVAKNIILSKVQ